MLEHINTPTTIHKNIISWCLEYGEQIMNNSDDDDNLAYDPVVFNLISRVNTVNKRGGDAHLVTTFEINRYLEQTIKKILESNEYNKVEELRNTLSENELEKVIIGMYPKYLIDLLYQPSIALIPLLSED